MPWPLSQDYNEAVQNPAQCFADPELRQGEAETNALGLPVPRSGNFADVYAIVTRQRKWAVKCFTRQIPGLQERYQQISLHLAQVKLPFMVDFTFLQRGIRVRNDWYPVLKMQWVEGLTLNQFVKSNLDKPKVLDLLCRLWLKLATRLREANIAHCDLQHGNVLLVPGGKTGTLSVKLVDYDGMCVPSLTLLKSIEVGHPAYQHPQRQREGIYSLEVDRFSHLVIFTALRALMHDGKALWDKHDDGDNLLFKPGDFLAPTRSPLVERLLTLGSEDVRKLGQAMVQSLSGPLDQVPLLDSLVTMKPATVVEPTKAATAVVAKRNVEASPEEIDVVTPAADFSSAALLPLPSARKPRRAAQRKSPIDKRLIIGGAGGIALLLILALFLALRGNSKPVPAPAHTEDKPKKTEKKTDTPKGLAQTQPIAQAPPKPEEKPTTRPQPTQQKAPASKPNQEADETRVVDRESASPGKETDRSARANNSGKALLSWGDVIDPDHDCEIAVLKDKLRITVPGTSHDFSAELNRLNAPHTLIPVQGDFIVDVKACGKLQPGNQSTIPGRKAYHGIGLLVFKDRDNYLRLDRGAINQGIRVVQFASFEQRQGGLTVKGPPPILLDLQDTYLRVARRGNEFHALASTDGLDWKDLPRPMVVEFPQELRVGVLAVSSSDQPLECTFEAFVVRAGTGLDEHGPAGK